MRSYGKLGLVAMVLVAFEAPVPGGATPLPE